tara:strand:+ start:352 stop:1779 length:1428 start_codon:yes stop_codon:yes gene_type:complete
MNISAKKIVPIIMAGGSGTRLWPYSRSSFPKQFQSLHGKNSLFQETILRLSGLVIEEPFFVVNEEHKFIAKDQIDELNLPGKIILEPESRNTAPAVSLGAHYSSMLYGDDVYLLILSADHVIEEQEKFVETINQAILIADQDRIITFGISPTSAHTGYGYIEKGEKMKHSSAHLVKSFTEKPSKDVAEEYVNSGNFLWNSGMLLVKGDILHSELRNHCEDIFDVTQKCISSSDLDEVFLPTNSALFSKCRNESIDFALMEKTSKLSVMPLSVTWSDLGSWSSLWDVSKKDEKGNVLKGDIHLFDSKNCYVRSDERFVSVIGLDNIAVIDTKDALLVTSIEKSQEVRKSVEHLQSNQKGGWDHHTSVHRPWGKFESIEIGDNFQVKKITVKPYERLSLQMHHHRAEHWIVVSGSAKVTCGDDEFLLHENESTFIPKGSKHRLENILEKPLILIEVQSGEYLGEDDIVRFDDKYGRD